MVSAMNFWYFRHFPYTGRCIVAWQAQYLARVGFHKCKQTVARTVLCEVLRFPCYEYSFVARTTIGSCGHACLHPCHCVFCVSRSCCATLVAGAILSEPFLSRDLNRRRTFSRWHRCQRIRILHHSMLPSWFVGNVSRVLLWHGLSVVHSTSSSNSPHQSTSHNHLTSHPISSHHITSRHFTWHHIDPAPSHHIKSHHIALHGVPSHMTSHQITDHHITSHDITGHDIHITSSHFTTQPTTLPHLTPPRNQPHYFMSPRNHDIIPHHIAAHHITTADTPRKHSQPPPKHKHQTERLKGGAHKKTRFGQRTGWGPCAHSMGKFFLWLIGFFAAETSATGSPGNYWQINIDMFILYIYTYFSIYICIFYNTTYCMYKYIICLQWSGHVSKWLESWKSAKGEDVRKNS